MTSKKVKKGRRLGSGHSKQMDRSQDYRVQQNNYVAVTPSNYQSEQAPMRDERSFNRCAPSVRKFKNDGKRQIDENNPNGGLSGSQSFRQIQKLAR